jgi:bacteriorhodopsin
MDQTRPLRTTLRALLDSHSRANPAFNRLLRDYTDYHWVEVVLGGTMTLALLTLSVFLWRRVRRRPRERIYLWLALPATVVALFMALVLAANISTVANPRPGFAHVIDTLPATSAGSYRAHLHHSFDAWMRSGAQRPPARVQQAVDARLSWQRPKAIICAVLFLGAALLTFGIWRAFDRRTRGHRGMLLAAGIVTSLATLVLMTMAIGNTQATIAPIALTLLYG